MARTHPIIHDLLIGGVVQVLALLFTECVLDMGGFAAATGRMSGGYWLGTMIVILRRHNAPTAGDHLFLRWGLIPVLAGGVPATLTLWAYLGAFD